MDDNIESLRKRFKFSLDDDPVEDEFEKLTREITDIGEEQAQASSGDNNSNQEMYMERANVIKNIPKFWYHTIMFNPKLKYLFRGFQKDCLKYLLSIEVDEVEELYGAYRIIFCFQINPFFVSQLLIKTIYPYHDPPSCNTLILWKRRIIWQRPLDQPSCSVIFADNFLEWYFEDKCKNTSDIGEAFKEVWETPLKWYLEYLKYKSKRQNRSYSYKRRIDEESSMDDNSSEAEL